ncbi:MAG: 2-oxo acid dehydrogenase subunit E2 [Bacteroidales bacterium]|nr:2-oxo acid dehydrogenase subunit E2 [Bacteroidales bacterium]
MATLIIMPRQGQSVETCIISSINKQKGDTVKKGDILFSYETDKASFEEESPVDGTVLEVFYEEDDEVPVLNNMMIIGEPGEDYFDLLGTDSDLSKEDQTESSVKEPETQNTELETQNLSTQAGSQHETFISPRARNLASKEVVDVIPISGSGPKGRIIEKDIQAVLENRPKMTPLAKKIASEEKLQPEIGTGLAGTARSVDLSAPVNPIYAGDYEDKKLSNMRKLIASAMYSSLQNSAQLTHHLGADARRILNLRKKIKADIESGTLTANITINDMVCFAVIKALKKYPNVNSHFLGDSMRLFNKVHLGLAVDTERGLMVPVTKNADDLSIIGLSNQLKEVANACKTGSVNPDILSAEAGSFTVSNLGNYGVEMFTPVINLPQSAILGVNTIVPRPKDLGGGVYGFVPYIGLSLTYDHRALDGGEATRFLKQVALEIENLEIEY